MTLNAVKGAAEAIDRGAQAQIAALDASHAQDVSYYDGLLSSARAQLDTLKGIDSGVLSVADALGNFAALMGVSLPRSQALPSIGKQRPRLRAYTCRAR